MSANHSPLIDILILNWNGYQLTKDCISSLKKISYSNYRIVLVDNGSIDGSVEKLTSEFDDLVIIENETNLGYAGGNNIGIDWIIKDQKSEFTLVLNNDTTVSKDFMEPLIECFEEPSCGIVTPVIFFMEPRDEKIIWALGGKCNFWIGKFGSFMRKTPYEVVKNDIPNIQMDYISGCCFLVRNSIFNKTELFKSSFFAYYEDTDFSYRLKKLGYKLHIATNSFIRHVAGGSSQQKTGGKSALGWYLYLRNQLWFFKRHGQFYHYPTYTLVKSLEVIYLIVSHLLNIKKLKGITFGMIHGLFSNENSFNRSIPV
ncbi:MAG: glycosyltransferase family 2 protein [Reichenbachiella sp.]